MDFFFKMYIFSSLGLNITFWDRKEETPPKRVKSEDFPSSKPTKTLPKKKKNIEKKKNFRPAWPELLVYEIGNMIFFSFLPKI